MDTQAQIINFSVYKWKGYFILANSEEQAQRMWYTWIDSLRISAEDGKPELLKMVTTLENLNDSNLFPKLLNGIKCEYCYPCIVRDLEWEKDPVFVYKHLI